MVAAFYWITTTALRVLFVAYAWRERLPLMKWLALWCAFMASAQLALYLSSGAKNPAFFISEVLTAIAFGAIANRNDREA